MKFNRTIIIIILLLSPWVYGKQSDAPIDSVYVVTGNVVSKSNSSVSGLKVIREYYLPNDSTYLFKDTSILPRFGTYGFFTTPAITNSNGSFIVRDSFEHYYDYPYIRILLLNANDTIEGPLLIIDSSQKNEILGNRADCSHHATSTREEFTFNSFTIVVP
jgi:hypothetical protein